MGNRNSYQEQYQSTFCQGIVAIIEQSKTISQIRTQLSLQLGQIYEIYAYFDKLDCSYKGYIELDDFIRQFQKVNQNFVELPYLQYLFVRIKKSKQKENILFFEEFIKGISIFCLMNGQSILEFVFDCVDVDDDDRISKEDIRKFLQYRNPKNGNFIFFTNFIQEVDKIKLKQNQTLLDFQQFRSNSDRLHFLIWPAYKLQDTFRRNILGSQAWFELYSKAEKRQYQIKNNEKKESRLKQKLEILKSIKISEQGPFFKDSIKERKCGQLNTDDKISTELPKRKRRRSCAYIKPPLQIFSKEEDPFIGGTKTK